MPKNERSFRYKKPTKEALRERANQRGGNYDSYINQKFKMYKVRDGKNIIRILPPTWDNNPDNYYGYTIFVNYQIGADNQSYLSLSKMKGAKDPIAEARLVAEREGDEDLAKQLRPSERVLMWIIDRQAEDEGPLLWAAPFSKVAKAFLNLAFDEDTGTVVYVDDPDEGHDIRFYKTGSQLSTEYDASKMKVLGASPLSEDEDKQAEWLNYVQENPLPGTLQFYDYKHISKVFNGGGKVGDDDEAPKGNGKPRGGFKGDEDDDDASASKRTRPRPAAEAAKAYSAMTDEDDDEPTSRRRSPPADEDEGDEPVVNESIRERIKRRRAEAAAHDDD